jgi:hypothetical protein
MLRIFERTDEFVCNFSVTKPFIFILSGSSIGAQTNPYWCATLRPMDRTLFKWNAISGGTYSTDPAKSYFYLYMGNSLSSSYMINDDDTGMGLPLCEQ